MIHWKRKLAPVRAFVPRLVPARAAHVLFSWPWGPTGGRKLVLGVGCTVGGRGELTWTPDAPEPEEGMRARLAAALDEAMQSLGLSGSPIRGCPAFLPTLKLPRRGALEIVECAVLLEGSGSADLVQVRIRTGDGGQRTCAVARRVARGEYEVSLSAGIDPVQASALPLVALRRGMRWPQTAVLREAPPREGERFVLVPADPLAGG